MESKYLSQYKIYPKLKKHPVHKISKKNKTESHVKNKNIPTHYEIFPR